MLFRLHTQPEMRHALILLCWCDLITGSDLDEWYSLHLPDADELKVDISTTRKLPRIGNADEGLHWSHPAIVKVGYAYRKIPHRTEEYRWNRGSPSGRFCWRWVVLPSLSVSVDISSCNGNVACMVWACHYCWWSRSAITLRLPCLKGSNVLQYEAIAKAYCVATTRSAGYTLAMHNVW